GAAPLSVLPDADTLSAREGGRPMAPETGISNARYPDDFETFWRKSVQEGGLTLPGSPARFADVFRRPGDSTALGLPTPPAPGLKLHVHPSLAFYDGRSANRSWLQEMPDPMTRAVWDSWVELHPETARALGVQTGDRVRLTTAAGSCETAAFVWDGVAKETAALATGQGHTAGGRTARGVGVNAFALLSAPETTPDAKPSLPVKIEKVAGAGELVRAHGEQRQHGREIVQTIALSSLAIARPDKVHLPLPQGYEHEHDVYKGHDHPAHRWAMAVDLDRCNGCNACVVACYAENNIPVVGKKEVGRRHEQPWIRIDRYDEGEGAQTRSAFQPMLCQHCDSAPCETVCPAYATVHSPEGLNEQVYNRCVGTRYCANNCPYKARRFNWFNPEWPEPLPLQLNPDVTVRSRGVMEKCTFCVQRIKEVTIRAKAEARPVKDGEITPACAQTCPAEAIVFGDLMDHGSRIARIVAEDPRRYQVLRELNTKPAVFYRKRIVDGD
ncbi:MAG: 4Fe-4S dicluster domain-containing protein, partial [Armatimonadetes bacterium]|nr:4Fe-4S dicluster domain-containing protein [Armatimonadota bacterium]